MAEPTPRRNESRLRPAPLLFEPAEAASDPEHFFDLESIDDPRALLARATELTLAFRALFSAVYWLVFVRRPHA